MHLEKPLRRDSDREPAADVGLRREHRRLRRAFAALLFALAPAAAAQACGHAGPPEVTGEDAGRDVASGHDAGPTADAKLPSNVDAAPVDAGDDRDCTLSVATVEGGKDADMDGEPSCIYTLPCGLPGALVPVGCDLYTTKDASFGCSLVEGQGCLSGVYVPPSGGGVQMYCPECLGGGGRRPRGLARVREVCAPTPLGAYFARMAHDEAASVFAFRRMRDELALHGAPPLLVRAADRSARDEERHARAMARRARTHAARIPSPRLRSSGPRSLEAIARENAVEGCVHETFGALIAWWQAAHARDASLRRTFARIAADETRHAALAAAVARWAEARLDPGGRSRVAAARARALRSLRRSLGSSAFDVEVGRPAPAEGIALLEGMIRQLGLG